MVVGAYNLGFSLLIVVHLFAFLAVERLEQLPNLFLAFSVLEKGLVSDHFLFIVVEVSVFFFVCVVGVDLMGLVATLFRMNY